VSDRVLATHVGALQRTPEAEAALLGEAPEEQLAGAVADVVRRQVEAGIDVVNDGEYGKSIWQWYVTERLDGIERQEREGLAPMRGRAHLEFPDFYAYALETPDVLFHGSDRAFWNAIATVPVCVGPIAYKTGPVERDIANLKAALEDVDVADAFLPVVAPASAEVDMGNEHYRAYCRTRVEALNHALEDLPVERVRYHLCWGSWHGPHATDIPLVEIVDLMLAVNAGTYLVEAANVRHEHEYHLWETVQLPEGKKLAPGVVTHSTNLIEHPELVAERIVRFADRVGRENVIASADCGMGSRIHPELGWAKLAALVDGAGLATERLWGHG
jgi:5-methyltetrahydropteroyltriglutamate--homocysteine methyltransferase